MTTVLKVTEKEWQRTVIDTAQARGWRVAHFRTSRTGSGGYATAVQADGAGFPDLVMVRGGRLLLIELKAPKGRLSAAQTTWMSELLDVADAVQRHLPGAVEAHIWKPEDWPLVERTLR